MAISYPSIILGGGGLSTVYTSGSITGSGELENQVRLKENIEVTEITASIVSASQLILDDDPYARIAGGNTFDSTNNFNYLTANNTVIVDGTNNSDNAYVFLQGSVESRLRIRKGFTEVGSLYNSDTNLVLEANNQLQITGSTALSGNLQLNGALVNNNDKILLDSLLATVIDSADISTKCAKYTLLVETATGTYHVQSCDLLLANNGSTVLITPYAVVSTNGSYLASFDAQINGGNIELLATKLTVEDITITMTKTYLS